MGYRTGASARSRRSVDTAGFVRGNGIECRESAVQVSRMNNPFSYFKTSPEIIRVAVML